MIVKFGLFVVFLINKNKLLDLLLLVLICLSVFYDPILSIDYYNYDKSLRLEQIERWEPLYQFIGNISILFDVENRVNVFFSLSVILSLIVLKKTINLFEVGYDKLFFIILLMAFPKGFFWIFNIPRQYLSVFLCFYALINLEKKNLVMFFFISLLASLTHISSFPFLALFYLFDKLNLKELNKIKYIIIILFTVVLIWHDLIYNFVLETTIPRLDMISFLDKSGKNYLYLLTSLSLIILFFNKQKKWVFLTTLMLILLFTFDYLGMSAVRLSYFIIPYLIYDLVKLLNKFKPPIINNFIKLITLLVFVLLNMYITKT